MMRSTFQRLALGLFLLYLAVFPGSTIALALDRVPVWGAWMGGALLLVQGACVLCWLLAGYGRRGALAAALIFLFAWGIEHLGVASGFPFGGYHYTGVLQPQLPGVVPLAIPFAWLMVTVGAWQLATHRQPTTHYPPLTADDRGWRMEDSSFSAYEMRSSILYPLSSIVGTATLVLLLDLQIETIATAINGYWIWLEPGPYYGVPTANFIAWWLVGGGMGLVIARVLREPRTTQRVPDREPRGEQRTKNKDQKVQNREPRTENRPPTTHHRPPTTEHPALERLHAPCFTFHASRFSHHVSRLQQAIPACLYLLSTLMFTVVNLARGYVVAGLVGLAVVLWAALRAGGVRPATADARAARQTSD